MPLFSDAWGFRSALCTTQKRMLRLFIVSRKGGVKTCIIIHLEMVKKLIVYIHSTI